MWLRYMRIVRPGPGNHNAILVGKHASYLILIAFDKSIHYDYPLSLYLNIEDRRSMSLDTAFAGLRCQV